MYVDRLIPNVIQDMALILVQGFSFELSLFGEFLGQFSPLHGYCMSEGIFLKIFFPTEMKVNIFLIGGFV